MDKKKNKKDIVHPDIFHAVIGKSEALSLPDGYEVWRKEIISASATCRNTWR